MSDFGMPLEAPHPDTITRPTKAHEPACGTYKWPYYDPYWCDQWQDPFDIWDDGGWGDCYSGFHP